MTNTWFVTGTSTGVGKTEVCAGLLEAAAELGDIGYHVYGAGLVLAFCMGGGDKAATEALLKVTDAFTSGKKVAKNVRQLEKAIAKREQQLAGYLTKVVGE